jgi:uncharacterized protein
VITVTLLWAAVVVAGMNEGLMAAAYRGDLPEVQRLLAKGAEVNAKMDDGRTALMIASQKGHAEVSALLIKAGAK